MALRFIDQEPPEPVQLPAVQPMDTSAMEQDMGDQAGLKPLPLPRMYQQAGRPMSPASRGQDSPYGPREGLKVDPALHSLTIERNQRNQQAIENWDPIQAESRQRLNNTNPNPRSRPSAPDDKTTQRFFSQLGTTARDRANRAFHTSRKDDPGWSRSGPEFREWIGQEEQARRSADLAHFLTEKELAAAKSMVFDFLDSRAGGRTKLERGDLPAGINSHFRKLGNDMLYEWNARRQKALRERTLDMLEIRQETIRGI